MTIDELPDFLTIEETARVLRIGRAQAYELARLWERTNGTRGIPTVTFGSRTKRVPKAALQAYQFPTAG